MVCTVRKAATLSRRLRSRAVATLSTVIFLGALTVALPVGAAEKLTAEQAVDLYGQAWAEPDEAKRRALLERAWAENGVYTDPTAEVNGREALVKHIGGFMENSRGGRIVITSKVDSHHETRLRFSWAMQSADGKTVAEGIDYGELDEDGKLKLIVGFFGPFQPLDSE